MFNVVHRPHHCRLDGKLWQRKPITTRQVVEWRGCCEAKGLPAGKPRRFPALAVKNIQASLIFLARLLLSLPVVIR